jgi:replicative DNA helicase
MATLDLNLERGLPSSIDAERSILGAILLDNAAFFEASQKLKADDFSLESHRRLYGRMEELSSTGRPIDIITIAEELSKRKEVESVGGVAYISSLMDGLPRRPSIEQYVRIVKEKAILRNLIHSCHSISARAVEQGDPVEEILDDAERQILEIGDERTTGGFVDIGTIFRENVGSIDKLYENGQRITGLETHYTDLDNLTSGLQKQDLVILAARPSMGKTAFAMNIAENVSCLGRKGVAVFSLEMSRQSLMMRMLCSQSRVDAHKLRTGYLAREDRQKLVEGLGRLAEAPLYVDDTAGITLSEMRAKLRRLRQNLRQNGGDLDLIVVDYLQLITASGAGGKRFENRNQEVSAISRGLKMIAKEMDLPIIALSQLSRAAETREKGGEPKLSDLRESGSIEQDADIVMFIHRPEYYERDNPELEGKAKIIIAKQRNGPTESVQMAFLKQFTRFDNLDRSYWVDDGGSAS